MNIANMYQYDGFENKVLYSRTCIVNSHNDDTLCNVNEYCQSLQVFFTIILL